MPLKLWGSHKTEFCNGDGLMKRQCTWAYSWGSHSIWREICWRSKMTSADTRQCIRLGTLLLLGIFCTDDELYNVSPKWHQKWANSSTEGNLSWTTLYAALVILVECFATKVEIFSLGIFFGYAAWLSPELLIRTVADVIAKIAEEWKEWGQFLNKNEVTTATKSRSWSLW